MRFVDEYRAPEQVMQLIEHLRERASHLSYTAERPLRIMEVCGGHTHAIFKFGLDQLLPENVEFIHGPGCPVCVLPMGRIDTCVEIASHPEVIFCTFGDAMRVPGKQGSLLQAKARGADVRIVYSPMDALKLAQENPTRKVVFFGLGFETTMPTTAITLQQAKARDVQNFYFFCQHITLIPTLRDIPGVKALRDATRGGVNAVVHEFAAACGCGIEISESALPVKPAVRGVCELLGLDALNFANEGKLVIAVERNAAEQVLAALHSHPLGKDAALIGEVVERKGVRLAGLYGVKRTLDLPHAEPLPRIC